MCPPSATKPVVAYCDSTVVAPSSEASMMSLPHAVVGKTNCPGTLPEMPSGYSEFSGQSHGVVAVSPLSTPPNMSPSLSPEMASSLRPSRVSPSSEQATEMCTELENEAPNVVGAGNCIASDVCGELERNAVSCETHATLTPVATTGGEEGESECACSDTDETESDDFSTCVAEDRDLHAHADMVSAQPSVSDLRDASACIQKSDWEFFESHTSWHVRVAQDANDREMVSHEDETGVPTPQCRLPVGLRTRDKKRVSNGFSYADGSESDRHSLLILQENQSTCCHEPTDDAEEEETPRGCEMYQGESDCIDDSCCGFVRHREDDAGETESSLGEATGLCLHAENNDEGTSAPTTPRGCSLYRVSVDFQGGLGDHCDWQSNSENILELHEAEETSMGKLFTSLEYLRHQEQSCGSLESDAYESEDDMPLESASYASPRCFHAMPSEEAFSRQETVFIFDWDDTLLPSSWISQKGLTLESAESEVSLWRMKLAQTAMWAEQTLFTARTLGQVIIVTNAESGWIDLSCSKFLPELRGVLNCFPIVSARSMYESAWCNTPFMWKEAAFMHELQRHFRMESKRWNVISVGDSTHEREALLAVCSRLSKMYHVTTKSLKLLESPAVEELHSQHELMSKCLAAVARHKGHLDLCITNATEPEIDPAAVKLPPALQGRAVGVHRIRHHPLSQELIGCA